MLWYKNSYKYMPVYINIIITLFLIRCINKLTNFSSNKSVHLSIYYLFSCPKKSFSSQQKYVNLHIYILVCLLFFLSKWFKRFTNKTILRNKLWNKKNNNNREKEYNKTMTKHIRYLNNIFRMLRQWWKSRIKWHKKNGSKKSTTPKEKAKLH